MTGCATWDSFRSAVDALAWDGARFNASDVVALESLSLTRLCELTLTARVREYNQLALDAWRAANPMPAPAK